MAWSPAPTSLPSATAGASSGRDRAGAAEAGLGQGGDVITIEDEIGVANLILWPDRYEKQRRLVLSAGMIACHGKVQREGDVTHVITDRLEDLSELLRSVGERDEAFRSSVAAAMASPIPPVQTRAGPSTAASGRSTTSTCRTDGSGPSRCRRGTSGEGSFSVVGGQWTRPPHSAAFAVLARLL